MFSTAAHYSLGGNLYKAATDYGVSKGFLSWRKDRIKSNLENRTLDEVRSASASDLGFTFWDVHKLSIITDLVIAAMVLITCLGVAFGCPSPQPWVWAITGCSLVAASIILDVAGFQLNVIRLAYKMSDFFDARNTARETRVNNCL